MTEHNHHKFGAVVAFAGALLLFAGTLLHPVQADPNDPLAAFAEYASDRLWVLSHLMQFMGMLLMVFALVLLARMLYGGRGASWAHLGVAGAGATLAMAAALQAVDGVALKVMVNRWAAAPAAEKEMVFLAAFGVRQVEVGLASLLSILLGITVTVYGAALVSDSDFPNWLGWLAIAGGVPTAVSGVVMAYTGFSNAAMLINMSASTVLLIWISAVGGWMWRMAPSRGST